MAESKLLGKASVVVRLAVAAAVGGALVAGISLPAVGAIGTFVSLRAALLSSALLLTPVLGLIRYTALRHERAIVPTPVPVEVTEG